MRPDCAVIVCVVLAAGGCRRSWHPEPFDPKEVSPAMAAPGGESADAKRTEPPTPEPTLERKRRMAEMQRHFEVVGTLEDEIIAGDLVGLRDLSKGFAIAHQNAEYPAAWQPYVSQMIEAAQQAARAEDIPAAAHNVAALAGTCGDCHRALDVGLADRSADLPAFDQGRSDAAAMRRHAWSVDRMWEGIVLPSEVRWIRGTAMFTFPPGCERGDERSTPSPDQALCRRIEGLGKQAHIAPDWEARVELYGRLLATCAQCHATQRHR